MGCQGENPFKTTRHSTYFDSPGLLVLKIHFQDATVAYVCIPLAQSYQQKGKESFIFVNERKFRTKCQVNDN